MGTPNREAIIQASSTIARLREEVSRLREELRRQESNLDRLLAGEAPGGTSTAPVAAVDKSLNTKIIDLLKSALGRDFSADDIAPYFPNANLASIRSGLARLADQGKIRRAGRGRYASLDQLPEQSPEQAIVDGA